MECAKQTVARYEESWIQSSLAWNQTWQVWTIRTILFPITSFCLTLDSIAYLRVKFHSQICNHVANSRLLYLLVDASARTWCHHIDLFGFGNFCESILFGFPLAQNIGASTAFCAKIIEPYKKEETKTGPSGIGAVFSIYSTTPTAKS